MTTEREAKERIEQYETDVWVSATAPYHERFIMFTSSNLDRTKSLTVSLFHCFYISVTRVKGKLCKIEFLFRLGKFGAMTQVWL